MRNIHIDLSHTVEHGMLTYPGLPAPLIGDFLSREASRANYAAGTEFQIGKIEMVANTGTYMDSPFHRFATGKDLSELPLESLAYLNCVVVRTRVDSQWAVGADAFTGLELSGKAVLVETGWDRHWITDQYFHGHPFLTRDAADHLVNAGAALVGIDSLNIDDTADLARPVPLFSTPISPSSSTCAGLDRVPAGPARFTAVPVTVRAFGSFPVRAFVTI